MSVSGKVASLGYSSSLVHVRRYIPGDTSFLELLTSTQLAILIMSINQSPHAGHVEHFQGKAEQQHLELSRTLTVQPLPSAAKAEGGLLLDAEGIDDPTSLRLAPDGHVSLFPLAFHVETCTDLPLTQTVLLPQPTNDPNDPLNWSWTRKHAILFTVAWAGLCADWTSASGPSVIFQQAAQWDMSPNTANRPNSINILFG